MEFLKEIRMKNELAKREIKEGKELMVVATHITVMSLVTIAGFVIVYIMRAIKGQPNSTVGFLAVIVIAGLLAWASESSYANGEQMVKVELIDDDILDEVDYLNGLIERGAKYQVIGDIDKDALVQIDREYEVELSNPDKYSQSFLTFRTPEGMERTIPVNREDLGVTKGIVREVVSVSLKNRRPVNTVNVAHLKTPL